MKAPSVRVLVCGSREWRDMAFTTIVLAGIQRLHKPPYVLIHGDARGADRCAAASARDLGWEVEAFPADWRGHGKAAGPIRNKLMLADGHPNVVIAFKDGFDWTLQRGGTENMVRLANEAGVLTYVISTGNGRYLVQEVPGHG